MKQRTLKSAFTVTGKGLHTGLTIEASFNPAPENHVYGRTHQHRLQYKEVQKEECTVCHIYTISSVADFR